MGAHGRDRFVLLCTVYILKLACCDNIVMASTISPPVFVVTSSPTMTVERLNRTSVFVQASSSANTAVSSDEASSKSAVLPFAQATTSVSLTTETSLEPTIASTVKPTTSLSVNALGVPCKSPCLLVSTATEIIALDYNDGIIYPVISNLTRAVAIDVHFNLGYIFWSDVTERTIKRARNDGTNITVLHNDTGDIGGLAVDWMSLQLYWTDELYNRISVSDLEGNNLRILLSLSLDEPRGIALDPNHGFMFWTDFGQIPKIERATLSGNQRVVIVASHLQWPVGIDLDRRNRLLFWVDSKMDRVESVDYHGNNRKLLFQQGWFLFFGVTFFSSNLFISDWVSDGIYKLNASHTNGTFVSSIFFKNIHTLFGIIAYDSSRQLPVLGVPCNSPCLLVSTTTEITALDYNSATTHPIISNLTRAVAIDVHFGLHYIFWSDVVERNIKRASIDGKNITVIHNNTVSDALAVEWKSFQLYWIDRIGTIWISDFEGNNKRILLSSQGRLSTYRGIVLDPEHDLMFWTDSNSGIKRSTLNGTQRTVLVTSLRWAQGIDLDRRNKLVFWVDAETGSVESVDYDGNNRILLYRHGDSAQGNFSFFGLAFFSSYLFVSDPRTRGVVKVNTANRSSAIPTFVSLTNPPMGLVPYDSSRQLPAITCPAFPAPRNGIRFGCSGSATEYYYNTVCQFACNSGYIGYGSQARRCQYNGTWSGQVFTCQMAVCRSYITLSEAGRAQGSLLQGNPRCDRWDLEPGWYRFKGPAGYRMADKCVPILHCGTIAPGWLSGAHPTVIEGVVTRKVCYHFYDNCCNWNNTIRVRNCGSYFVYELRRAPICQTRYCGNAGAGNSSCLPLPAPSNGTKFGCPENATVYNDTVCQFSCNDGYIGSGSQARRCQHNGTWSGQDLTCHIINCTSLTQMVDPGGPLRMGSCANHFGAQCNFFCTTGYRLNGSSTVKCVAPGNQHPGVWNNTIPTCEEILCEPLQLAPNLKVNTSCSRLPGDSCEFACERGYDLIGSSIRTCSSEGSWTGTQPRCDAVTCSELSPPASGELLGCNTTEMLYKTVCRFSCNEGYEAKGSMARRCTENGTWSGTKLVCIGICGAVEAQETSASRKTPLRQTRLN